MKREKELFELTLIIAFFVLDGEIEACALNLHSYHVETNCSNSIGCYGCMCNPRCSGRGRDFTGKVILVNQDSREEDLAKEKRVIPRRRKDENSSEMYKNENFTSKACKTTVFRR